MPRPSDGELLRQLPSVDEMLRHEAIRSELKRHPKSLVTKSIREVIASHRKAILEGKIPTDSGSLQPANLISEIRQHLYQRLRPTLRPVINATGIVVHTNLGRSLLPTEALENLRHIASHYNTLEYNVSSGRRGSRYVHAEELLKELTGAEAALVVNNNAAAVLLVLNTLASGKEVIVSRGQLVEIGGSFRIPDVMISSGAHLKEVGCTNRTHLRDYENAIGDETAILMKVHCSNYRVIGFTTEVSLNDLVVLGRKYGLPVVEDLGSGSFIDLSRMGLAKEPTAQEAIALGADVVTFSGDKLLGGPQAGIIVGRKDFIDQFKKNPLTRALRVDKMTLATLEIVLRLYRDPLLAMERIPTLRMLVRNLSDLEQEARELAQRLRALDRRNRFKIQTRLSVSQVGGGALPGHDIPTWTVSLQSDTMSCNKVEEHFRHNETPIIGRIEDDWFLLDVRTIQRTHWKSIEEAMDKLAQPPEEQ